MALSCAPVAGATSYQFSIDDQTSTGFSHYYTYTAAAASQTFYPQIHGVTYRWQVRAQVGGAYGAWSAYAEFAFK